MVDHTPIAEQGESRPRPDPTSLTVDLVYRELALHKETLAAQFDGIDARFEAMDKAIILLQTLTDRQPTTTTVAASVKSLEALTDANLAGLKTQLAERQIAQKDAKEASAEALRKSEETTNSKIDGLAGQFTTTAEGMRDKIAATETRITVIESRTNGAKEQKTETRAETSNQGVIYGIIFGAVSIIIAVVIALVK